MQNHLTCSLCSKNGFLGSLRAVAKMRFWNQIVCSYNGIVIKSVPVSLRSGWGQFLICWIVCICDKVYEVNAFGDIYAGYLQLLRFA